MALTYGFYDSINHDRVYSARQFNSFLEGVINDGVFRTIGDRFNVTRVTEEAWQVKVGSGKAFFNGIWTYNDSDDVVLNVDSSASQVHRYDSVILKIDETNRTNTIEIKKGEAVSSSTAREEIPKPALINEGGIHEYRLANLYIGPSASTIQVENTVIGTSETPYTLFSDLPYATNVTYGVFNAGTQATETGTYYELDPGINPAFILMASVRSRGGSNDYYYPYPEPFVKYNWNSSENPTSLGIIQKRISSSNNSELVYWVDSALNAQNGISNNPADLVTLQSYTQYGVRRVKFRFDKHYWFGCGYRFWLALGTPYETA